MDITGAVGTTLIEIVSMPLAFSGSRTDNEISTASISRAISHWIRPSDRGACSGHASTPSISHVTSNSSELELESETEPLNNIGISSGSSAHLHGIEYQQWELDFEW